MSETVPRGDAAAPSAPPSSRARRGARRPTAVAAAIDALQGFCLGADGRAAAASELRKLRLPADADHVDDLCQTVLVRLWARLDGGDPAADRELHAGIVPYARRSLHNAAIDLLRAARPERLDEVLAHRSGGSASGTDGSGAELRSTDGDDRAPLAWSDDIADRGYAPELRWALQRLQAARPRLDAWVVSAALTTTHLADHPDLDLLPDIPAPSPQSRAASAGARWAGLAYAGRRDCFAPPDTGAVRQRRSQALQRLDRTLVEATALVGGPDHLDGPGTDR